MVTTQNGGVGSFILLLCGIAISCTQIREIKKNVPLAPEQAQSVIEGRVTGDSHPLAGVLVSDGCQVVRTDETGCYRLQLGDASGPFVFVSIPAGYWTDSFFTSCEEVVPSGRADFELWSVEQTPQFTFAFLTDIHLEDRKWAVPKFEATVREINALEPLPEFLLLQGDICLEGKSGDVYLQSLKLARMPVRHGAGNHEMMRDHPDPRDDFHRLLGPTYYSFDWAGSHCIVLDGNKPIPGETDWRAVHGAIEGSELAWLKADLAAQPPGKPIIVGIHIPIVTTYPQRRAESPPDAPYWEVQNRDQLTKLFAKHGVRLVLQGHMHENERTVIDGVEYVSSISVCGSWWQAGEAMERGVDGVPRGYRLVFVDGTQVSHRYCSSGESRVDAPGEWTGLNQPLKTGQRVELIFNAFDAPNGSQASASLDGRTWEPMESFPAVNVKLGLKMQHHFRLNLDTSDLTPGKHHITVRVTRPDGTIVNSTHPLQIVPSSPKE